MTVDESAFEAARLTESDPHEAVDVAGTLSDVTVVIPTNREDNYTLRSLPDAVESVVATDDGLNVARNRGIERVETDWVVLADDDLTFPACLTALLVDAAHPRHLVGLEDYWPMEYLLGRYLVFHRSLWRAVGGFDESRRHGGDTDFCIRARKAGASLVRLPRHTVPHHDAASDKPFGEHVEWLWYLTRRHPRAVAPKAAKLALRKAGLLSPRRAEYPAGWSSTVWHPPGRESGRAATADGDGVETDEARRGSPEESPNGDADDGPGTEETP
jgi:glycosyltransferase involved in cell wall biosynthesis